MGAHRAEVAGSGANPSDRAGGPGFIGRDDEYARLVHLIRKGQIRVSIDRRAVRTYYLQRARVEQDLYLQILAVAYGRALCVLIGLAWVAYARTLQAMVVAVALLLLAAVLGWRQQARWMASVRRRLVQDRRFFDRAYEDGMITLRRGRRVCEFPRPWTAILGLESPSHSQLPSGAERARSMNRWESA
ncbi:MAG: hypothetical protein DIU69_11435 [Bacillota bacterium]|nr:MAG: hypothetical protein DIU69_11435 [Bacillota bacterium]